MDHNTRHDHGKCLTVPQISRDHDGRGREHACSLAHCRIDRFGRFDCYILALDTWWDSNQRGPMPIQASQR